MTCTHPKDEEIILYQCKNCEGMYTSLVSSCDCTAGDSFVYTVWIAKPKQVEE